MKLLSFSMLLASSLMADYTYSFSKTFTEFTTPKTIALSIDISLEKESEKEVLSSLNKFSDFITKYPDINKSGGNYQIHPKYEYEKNKRYKSNYVGNINYKIQTDQKSILRKFLSDLYNKKSDNQVDINTNSIMWNISNYQKENMVESLNISALQWSNNYADKLSKILHKECTLTKIITNSSNYSYPVATREEAMVTSPIPEQEDIKVSITANIEMECK